MLREAYIELRDERYDMGVLNRDMIHILVRTEFWGDSERKLSHNLAVEFETNPSPKNELEVILESKKIDVNELSKIEKKLSNLSNLHKESEYLIYNEVKDYVSKDESVLLDIYGSLDNSDTINRKE